MEGGGVYRPPFVFLPLLEISLGNQYLKFLDLSKLFESNLKYGTESRQRARGLNNTINGLHSE